MEDRIYLINLYDYYGDLLTEKQKEYFESYYFANLSLSEISENTKVSRNAVHKQLKEVKDLLRANGVKSEKLIEKALRDVYKVQPKQPGNKNNDNIEKWK